MNKAQIERLTQLALAAQGKPTKRPLKEMLLSERSAAAEYIPITSLTATGEEPAEERGEE